MVLFGCGQSMPDIKSLEPSVLCLNLSLPVLGSPTGIPNIPSNLPQDDPPPVVQLDYGSFQGFSTNTTISFLGLPYAQPPTGDLRFRLPQPPQNISGIYNATSLGNACPQQAAFGPDTVFPNITGLNISAIAEAMTQTRVEASEDCLYLNVVRPASVPGLVPLPVLIWIHGGGFAFGASSTYDPVPLIERSLNLQEPAILVSMNYRLNAFGFLGGNEVKEAGVGNLGLHDQRLAIQWVRKYIIAFGGNPLNVTLWGQGAGAVSVVSQMTAADGQADGLFQGAFLESGYPGPMNDISEGQPIYDQLVAATDCSSANSSSTLDCLRAAPYETVMQAVNNTPSYFSFAGLNSTWAPKVDGVFLNMTLREAFSEGAYAQIPVVAGDCDDEGTLFSLFSTNITTDEEFQAYVQSFLPGADDDQIASVAQQYPEDPSQGSPFGTGSNYTISPEYKRISAFVGDAVFQAPRRFMLNTLSQTQNTWAYLYQRSKNTPYLGSYFSSDIEEFLAQGSDYYLGADAVLNFANHYNPNVPTADLTDPVLTGWNYINWPQWSNSSGSPLIMVFDDPANLNVSYDNYRAQAMEVLNGLETQLFL